MSYIRIITATIMLVSILAPLGAESLWTRVPGTCALTCVQVRSATW